MQPDRRSLIRICFRLLTLLILSLLLAACSLTGGRDPHEIVYWTSQTDPIGIKTQHIAIAAFEKKYPYYHVRMVGMPSQGTGDATSLITAVRGGSPPDAFFIDRFTVSQQASIGLLTDLTPYIQSDHENLARHYLPFAWGEVNYLHHPYALPMGTDARGVYYNKDVLQQAGIDPANLDPSHGPMTIAEMLALAQKMNRTDARGNYTQLGFIPWGGQGEHATWALNLGAKYFNAKTCQVTLQEPAILQTYTYFQQWARQLNYAKVDTFTATYQPPNAPPGQTPFYTGHLGLGIDGDWNITGIEQYAPKLNYGITYLPVQHKGDKPFTWSGGFAAAVPTGAPNAAGGYKFIRFLAGEEGQRVYAEASHQMPTWSSLYSDHKLFTGPRKIFADMMAYSHSRVPLPVGAQLWDSMDSAQQEILLGNKSPEQAMSEAQTRIQPQMQQYCPFKLS